MGWGPECSSTRSCRWKWEIEPISPTVCERRFIRLGVKMTIHAAAMMITRIMGISSSTYAPCRKTLTTGNSAVVDGRGTTVPTSAAPRRPMAPPGCVVLNSYTGRWAPLNSWTTAQVTGVRVPP